LSHLINDPDFIGSRKVRQVLMNVIHAAENSPSVAETSTAPSLTEVDLGDIADGDGDGDASSKATSPAREELVPDAGRPQAAGC
jgi:hypothetical protein